MIDLGGFAGSMKQLTEMRPLGGTVKLAPPTK